MQILFVTGEHPTAPGSGGIGTFVQTTSEALARAGHDVHVLVCARGLRPGDQRIDGVLIHRRPEVRLRGLGALLRNEALALRIRAVVSAAWHQRRLRLRPDVIEVTDWLASGLLLGRSGGTVVLQLHGSLSAIQRFEGTARRRGDLLAAWLERLASRRTDLVVSPSASLLELLRDEGWFSPGTPAVVLPHPIEADRWTVDTPPSAASAVVCVTKFTPLKAVHRVLAAAARLPVTDWSLVIAGGVNESSRYGRDQRRAADTASFPVELVGEVGPDGLRHAYGRARVLVVPSRFEAYSLVALEAMAAGRPVICGPDAGVAELLREVDPSLVVEVDDADALAAAVASVLFDPERADRLGAACARAVRARCAPDELVARRMQHVLAVR